MLTRTRFRWAAIGASALICAAAPAETTTPIPALPDSHVNIVIGDVPGFLDRVGALAAAINPHEKPDVARSQFGSMVGDPQLSGMPPGSGLAVIVPKQGRPFGFLEVKQDSADKYEQALSRLGAKAVGKAEGLLLFAADQAGLEKARQMASDAGGRLLSGEGTPDLAVSVRLAELLGAYQSRIDAFLQKLKEKETAVGETSGTLAHPGAAGRMLGLYVSAGRKVETLEVTLKPSAEGLTFHSVVTPATPLKGSAPPEGVQSARQLMALLPGEGAIRSEMTFDPGALTEIGIWIVSELTKGTTATAESNADFVNWMRQGGQAWGGTMAMAFLTDENAPMSGAYAMTVRDEAAAIEFLAATPGKFRQSALGDFYADLGIRYDISFEKNVRQHGGAQIHRLKVDAEITSGAPEIQRRMMELMGRATYEIAVVEKVLLYAVEPVKIESLIDAARSGKHPTGRPLLSQEALPPGGRFYMDYRVGRVFAVVSRGLADQPASSGSGMLQRIAAGVKDAPPVQVAGYVEDGRLRFVKVIPAGLLRSFAEAFGEAFRSGRPGESREDQATTSTGSPAPTR